MTKLFSQARRLVVGLLSVCLCLTAAAVPGFPSDQAREKVSNRELGSDIQMTTACGWLLNPNRPCPISREQIQCAAAGADNWRLYGYDLGNSRCNGEQTLVDRSNVDDLTLKYQTNDRLGVTSTPAYDHGEIFFTTWNGQIISQDAASGTVNWATSLEPDVYIRPTPAVTNDRVYVSGSNRLWSLNRHGKVLWQVVVDLHPSTSLDASPIVVDDLIILGVASLEVTLIGAKDYTFRGNVVAFDRHRGEEQWRFYVTDDDQYGAGGSIWSSAAVDRDRGMIYIGTGQSYEKPASPLTDSILAIYYRDVGSHAAGTLAWHHQFTADDVYVIPGLLPPANGPDFDVGATPNLFKGAGRDLVGVGSKAGVYKAFDRSTGASLIWSKRLTRGSHLGGIMTSSVATKGVIYVNSNRWFGINADLFALTDSFTLLDISYTFALDANDGKILWRRRIPAPVFGALSASGGVIYHGDLAGHVYALDAKNGRVLYRRKLPNAVGSGFSIADGYWIAAHGFTLVVTANADDPEHVDTGGIAVFELD